MIAAKLATMPHGGNRRDPIKGPIGPLIADAAKLLNVSDRSVKRAM